MASSPAVLAAFQSGAGVSAGAMQLAAMLGLSALALLCGAWLAFRLLAALQGGDLERGQVIPYVVRAMLIVTLLLIFVLLP